MIFTSYTYVVFLAVAFIVHWSIPERWRNPFLIAMSYVFYCSWQWQYGFLLLGLSLFTWAYGRFLARTAAPHAWLPLGVAVEIGTLAYYKYTDFFLSNLESAARLAGAPLHIDVPRIVLPLGVSFFTFQGTAYLVDVASGVEPFTKPVDFVLYKSFWPQLIAGPIVRPDEIRDAVTTERRVTYDDLAWGGRRILEGFLKKAVLADTVAPIVDSVFAPHATPGFVDAVTGAVGFAVQIYFDFSGYSDIAIGSARLFGFTFPENFDWPYLSASWHEFWGRWHMTLSRWIRDYVFTPLMFASRGRRGVAGLWLVTAMALCGLWHGARWTFIAWGTLHGVFLVLDRTLLKPLFAELDPGGRSRFSVRGYFATLVVFSGTTLGWVLFRAQTFQQAAGMVRAIATLRGGLRPSVVRENGVLVVFAIFFGLVLFHALRPVRLRLREAAVAAWWRTPVAAAYYCAVIVSVIVFESNSRAFVYFQF